HTSVLRPEDGQPGDVCDRVPGQRERHVHRREPDFCERCSNGGSHLLGGCTGHGDPDRQRERRQRLGWWLGHGTCSKLRRRSDAGSYTVLVGQAAGAPIVDVAPYNYGKQDYSRCAVSCFATVYVQSTVPYLSLDTPRSVTLVYNSDRVNPRPFVHVNVTPDLSLGTPLEYQLQVKVNNAFVTFVNGDQTLRFMYPGSGKVRLGGQFDAAAANAGPTGV